MRTSRGLRARTAALVALGALVPLVALGLAGREALSGLEERVVVERRAEAQRAAAQLDGQMGRVVRALWDFGEGSSPEAQSRPMRTGLVAAAFRLDPAGVPCDPVPGDWPPLPPAELSARLAQAGLSGHIALLPAPAAVDLVMPLGGDGRPLAGFAVARLDLTRREFGAVFSPAPEGGSLDWISAEGIVLASSDLSRVGLSTGHGELLHRVRVGRGERAVGSCSGCHQASGLPLPAGEDELVAFGVTATADGGLALREPTASVFAPVRTFRRRLLWMVPLFVAIGGAFAWGAARSVRAPLHALTKSARRIAAGDLATPIPPLPPDEIGELGASLETMRAHLEAGVGEIRRANEELERRVAERTEELAAANRELAAREELRARLLARVLGAQEDERRRIARELHDETCQSVSALLVRVETALAGMKTDLAKERLGAIRTLAARILDELHRIIFDLRPSILDDLGLVSAIGWLVSRQVTPAGIAARLEIDELSERLPPAVEIAAFRTIQEALTNVVRHSKAETVLVEAQREAGRLRIWIEDDGIGFEPAEVARPAENGRGLGLAGMRERIELAGGTLRIESAPGGGCLVVAEIPLPAAATEGNG